MCRSFAFRLLSLSSLLLLGACTAAQRGWMHDNVPWIGSWFNPPYVPPPLWQACLQFVAGLFTDHPAEAVPATLAAAGAAAHGLGRIPGTHRHARRLEKVATKRAALAKANAALKHWDAVKAADVATRRAAKAKAEADAKLARAALVAPPIAPPAASS